MAQGETRKTKRVRLFTEFIAQTRRLRSASCRAVRIARLRSGKVAGVLASDEFLEARARSFALNEGATFFACVATDLRYASWSIHPKDTPTCP